jgi:outer membrane murein-binding lipoprotein Lpp
MRPLRIAVVVSSLLVAGCDSPRTELDAHDLAVAAQNLTSLAAEAEMLAQQLQARSLSADMAWVHQQALGEESLKVAQHLSKPVPRDLRAPYEKVASLNARLQTEVTRIASAANAPGELDALQREFHAIADAARPIGDSQ